MNFLVTGISRGVGLEIAKTLLESGHTVYGVNRSHTKELEKLEDQYKTKLFFKKVDLVNTESLRKDIFGDFLPNRIPIHGFVNNAAMAYDDIITNMNLELLEKMYRVNVFSPLMITKGVLRNMIFNKIKGSIVHISSISVHTGYKGLSMYAGSKGALEAFSKNTAREWGGRGIRSNCLVAGFMDTDMSSTLDDNKKQRIYKRTSLKRPTLTKDVAETVKFLLSNEASSITGQNIHVDSGTI